MFPIRDHNPSGRTPYVTLALIAINVVVFLSYWGLFSNPGALASFFGDWALEPVEVSAGESRLGLLTYMFLHGGFWHLAGNMLFLYIFGDNLEDAFGHLGFLAFYLACGVGAGLIQVVSDPGSAQPVVGASGAIAGVMGGYLLLFPRARVDMVFLIVVVPVFFTLPAWAMLGVWFVLQLVNGLGGVDAGVAYWAHAGGFAVGAALVAPWWLKNGGPDFWKRNHGHPPHPEIRVRRTPIPATGRRRLPRRGGPWAR